MKFNWKANDHVSEEKNPEVFTEKHSKDTTCIGRTQTAALPCWEESI
jgi:hypothetical protein